MKYILPLKTSALLACCLLAGCAGARTAGSGGCPPGMLAYWTFDEGASPDPDRSFLHGTAGFAAGVSGTGLEMDADGYALFHGLDLLDGLKRVTVEGWLKYRSMDPNNPGAKIFCKGGAFCVLAGCAGCVSTALAVNVHGAQDGIYARGSTELTPGKWHHTAFTFDGTTTRIYLDGRLNGSMVSPGAMIPDPGSPGIIGRYPYSPLGYQSPLDGFVDEVAVYDRPLTADEIASHYRLGLAGKGYCAAE